MNGYDHDSLLQGCLSLLGRILLPGGMSFAQTGLWKINSVSSVLHSYKENTHLRQEYLLPGLFWWPQICDSLPSHKRIQRPGDPWCPLQCRKFHEQHGDAEGPGDTQKKSMFQGTHPSSCWWIREMFLPCVKGPRGFGKSCLVHMEGKRATPALEKGRSPFMVSVLWPEIYPDCSYGSEHLQRWLPTTCRCFRVWLIPCASFRLQPSQHSSVQSVLIMNTLS